MICDKCGEEKPLTLIHIRTGKRGRPPIKHFCAECLKSPEVIIPGETVKAGNQTVTPVNLNGFYPPAIFLLSLLPDDLFESTNTEVKFRCIGCGEKVNRWDRKAHHAAHRKEILRAA